jgi:hypothetical protein
MNRIRFALAAAVSAIGLTSVHAVPGLKFDDNSELFVTGTASIAYDDNIFVSSADKKGDTIYDLIPGVDVPFGSVSDVSGDAFAKVDFVEYATHSGQDAALPDVGFNTAYDEGKSKFDVNAGYQQLAQNNATIRLSGVIVKTSETTAGLYGESGVTDKTSVGAGVNYMDTTYNQSSFVNSSVVSVPVDVYYAFSPKTDVSLGYKYTNSSQSGTALNYYDNFFNVGLRGEFSPLVTGQVRVGYDELEFSNNGGSRNLPGVDGNITYAPDEKDSYTLNLSNQYTNSGTGAVSKTALIGVSGSTALDPQWKLVPGVSYSEVEYPGTTPGRTDDIWTGSIGLVFVYNTYANVSLTYSLNNDSSSISTVSYSDSRIALALNLRY